MDNYTEIWHRIESIKMEISDIDDDYFMEEILFLDYSSSPKIMQVVNNYMKTGQITNEERIELESFYILTWIDEDTEE